MFTSLSTKSDSEGARIAAAIERVRAWPLLITPDTPIDDDHDFIYKAIDQFSDQFDAEIIRKASAALERCPRLPEQGGLCSPHPIDLASDLYTPKMDAAFYLGLAMGVRMANVFAGGGR